MVSADLQETTLQELRRGAIVLAVLSSLQVEHYGYSLREGLADDGLEIAEGTLYPLLRRLEGQGLLASRWDTGAGRPRRYYRLAPGGERALERLQSDWRELVTVVDAILDDGEETG